MHTDLKQQVKRLQYTINILNKFERLRTHLLTFLFAVCVFF